MKLEAKDGIATLWVYDPIGSMFGPDAVTAKGVRDKLSNLRGIKSLNVRINSPGGEVDDSIAIYTLLREFNGEVTTQNDGLAASSAATLFAAGDRRKIAKGATTMIHNPWGVAVGDYREFLKAAEVAKTYRDNLADLYAERFSMARQDVLEAMDAESYYTADQALEFGLATEAPDGAAEPTDGDGDGLINYAKEVAKIAACLLVSDPTTKAHADLAARAMEIGAKISAESRNRQLELLKRRIA